MKKIFCFLLVSIAATGVSAQLVFDALTFSPQFPKAGDKVTFQFTKNYSPLINEKQFDVAVYLFNNSGTKVLEPTLTRKGDTFSGNFLVDSNTNAIVFSFASETVKDNNKGKGYVVPIYNTNQKPIISSYPIISNLASGYGEYLFGTANDVNRSMIILEEGKKLYPDYRTNLSFYDTYLNALYSAKKKEAQPEIITELNILAAKTDLNEKDYTLMSNWYGRFKMKSAVDSINAIRNQKFPDGD
ncbi:MAG: hypothetical protein ABIO05_08160, partial [Ferruginibacter sp.]